ncbi:MAG: hypothetical protein NTV01_20475 [Bacteroidia bacterium]|nr:hypothetical protein [Bacteroidia bacterium]
MNLNDLVIRTQEIEKLVRERYPYDEGLKIGPIYDGIINLSQYIDAKYKILWILKEPYDEREGGRAFGGDWYLTELLNNIKIAEFKGAIRTYKPMILTSYSILNGFCPFDEITWIDSTVSDTLKSICYFNVKKLPGLTTSNPSVIKRAYNDNRDILLKQIQYYEPDIVIGGYTLNLFLHDLGIEPEQKIINCPGSFPHYIKGNKLYIDAYHPASRVVAKSYCENIIQIVQSVKEMWAR